MTGKIQTAEGDRVMTPKEIAESNERALREAGVHDPRAVEREAQREAWAQKLRRAEEERAYVNQVYDLEDVGRVAQHLGGDHAVLAAAILVGLRRLRQPGSM